MAFAKIHHYVPQWYQRRFFPSGFKDRQFHYLNLAPARIKHPNGTFHLESEYERWGTGKCFAEKHLYTLMFGNNATDIVEKRFFGSIDQAGKDAVDFFSNYSVSAKSREALDAITKYLDAQMLRTPKGLDYLKQLSQSTSHQQVLHVLRQIWKYHITIWMESVWEVLCCDESNTKFILTDHPATTYNKALDPKTKECHYPSDALIEHVGTHTIFPLDLNRCLVITNLEYVRNPKGDPLKIRENPRYFADTMFDLRKIQTGRQISESHVIAINYILKKRTRRYLAAVEKNWLHPEQNLVSLKWENLADQFFLMPDPRKVSFSTGMVVGFRNGTTWGVDEYGRHPRDPNPDIETRRYNEMKTFQEAKEEWDKEFGPLSAEEIQRSFSP